MKEKAANNGTCSHKVPRGPVLFADLFMSIPPNTLFDLVSVYTLVHTKLFQSFGLGLDLLVASRGTKIRR
jgi:hypothetical protein